VRSSSVRPIPFCPQVEARRVTRRRQAERQTAEVPEVDLVVGVAHREAETAHGFQTKRRRLEAHVVLELGQRADARLRRGGRAGEAPLRPSKRKNDDGERETG
jgi:hypothetical protein